MGMCNLCRGPTYLRAQKGMGVRAWRRYKARLRDEEIRRAGGEPPVELGQRFGDCGAALARSACPCMVSWTTAQAEEATCWQKLWMPASFGWELLKRLFYWALIQGLALLFYFLVVMKRGGDPERTGLGIGLGFQALFLLTLYWGWLRCVLVVWLPSLLTKEARLVMLLFVGMAVLSGPAQNLQTNQAAIAETLGCVHEAMHNETTAAKAYQKHKLRQNAEALAKAAHLIRAIGRKMAVTVEKIKGGMERLRLAAHKAAEFLKKAIGSCNTTANRPYYKCRDGVERLRNKCEAAVSSVLPGSLGSLASGVTCAWTAALKSACRVGRILNWFCKFPGKMADFLRSHVLDTIGEQIAKAASDLQDEYYFDVVVERKLSSKVQARSQMSEGLAALRALGEAVSEALQSLVVLLEFLTLLSVFFSLLGAIYYVYKYKGRDYHDNHYVEAELLRVEAEREAAGLETLLPLLPKEEEENLPVWTLRLRKSEKLKMFLAAVQTMAGGAFALLYMACDYVVWNFAAGVFQLFGRETAVDEPSYWTLEVTGAGLMAKAYQALLTALLPEAELKSSSMRWRQCIREASEPDWDLQLHVLYLLLGSLILVPLTVYFQRLRHVAAALFYPRRARPRALFLYNHLLKSRGGMLAFVKMACRKEGLAEALLAQQSNMARILPLLGAERQHCVRCLRSGKRDDKDNFAQCQTPACTASYCALCSGKLRDCLLCDQRFVSLFAGKLQEALDSSADEDFGLHEEEEPDKEEEDEEGPSQPSTDKPKPTS